MAIIHVEPQRESDIISLPRTRDRRFIFVTYEYGPITQEEEDLGLEWWFPKSNGNGYHSIIHFATLYMPDGADRIRLWLQCEEGDNRALVHEFYPLRDVEAVLPGVGYVVPHGCRGVLTFDRPDKDQVFKATYLVERI